MHNRITAPAVMDIMARPVAAGAHQHVSCGHSIDSMLEVWQHQHAALVLDDDRSCHLYGLQDAVEHYFQGVPLQNCGTERLRLQLRRSCASFHRTYACHACTHVQEGDQPL